MQIIKTVIFFASIVLVVPADLAFSGRYEVPSNRLRSARDQAARKVDEYGDLIQDDEGARLDAFESELRKEAGSRGYIIAYGGRDDPPGKARRYALRARVYLVEARGVVASRVESVDGGRRELLTVELWIAPAAAPAPAPTPTITGVNRPGDESRKYDEYSYGYGESWNRYEDSSIRLDGFAAVLENEPGARGYIIGYAQNGDDRTGIECDPSGNAIRIARTEKQYLIEKAHIGRTRIAAVNGGYSPIRMVELWIIPPGARPPRVRPNVCR
jgi:hypothetical protein